LAESIARADVVISTAAIPGKKAPVIITKEMIGAMKPGSVIIDMAASTGGNTEVTENGQTVVYHYVSVVGNSQLYCKAPIDASRMYGKNMLNFLDLIIDKSGAMLLNWEDELVKGACIAHAGKLVNERIEALLNAAKA
jgi:NAD(P) transhydrogenase subunit alpha